MADAPRLPDVTPDDAAGWMWAAFASLPSTPVFSRCVGAISSALLDVSGAQFDALAFAEHVLLPEREAEHRALMLWSRGKAREKLASRGLPGLTGGGTVADYCAARRLSRSTFEDQRRRACRLLAEAANRQRRSALLEPA